MQPNNDRRHIAIPQRDQNNKPDRDLAAALMREQINQLYDQPTQNSAASNDHNPYDHTQPKAAPVAQDDQWKKYHTAWQQYYQQYYQRYYMAEQQKLRAQDNSHQPAKSDPSPGNKIDVSPEQAVSEIRNELLNKVKKQSSKVRSSRHFVPIVSALVVMMLFMFMQYNRVMVAQVKAYVSPGSISPENVLVDTGNTAPVGMEPRLIIPKINVDAPLVYDVGSLAEGPVQEALKDGVIHYPIPGASSKPGEKGNSVFLGHSSNDVFDDGKYKFVFVQLEKMKERDTFFIHHEGTRYTYSVTGTEEILPTEVNKLITRSNKPTVTLVTCTPVGTALKRFLVHAEQISPDPASATEHDSSNDETPNDPPVISGNSPTLFERLFGG